MQVGDAGRDVAQNDVCSSLAAQHSEQPGTEVSTAEALCFTSGDSGIYTVYRYIFVVQATPSQNESGEVDTVYQ